MVLLTSELQRVGIKSKRYFASTVKFRVLKLQPEFFKQCTFSSCNTFSVLLYGYLFELILTFLTFENKGVRVLEVPSVK